MSKVKTLAPKYIRRIRKTPGGRHAWYEVQGKEGVRWKVKKPVGVIDHLLSEPVDA